MIGRSTQHTDDSQNISRINDGESKDIILPDFDSVDMPGNLSEAQVRKKKIKERQEKQRLIRIQSLFVFKDGIPIEFNDTSIAILTESKNKKID